MAQWMFPPLSLVLRIVGMIRDRRAGPDGPVTAGAPQAA
jgi:hypothetical protein